MKTVYAIVLALALQLAVLPSLRAGDRILVPDVPGDIAVPTGFKPFFAGHASGTQNYICAPSPTGPKWLFIGPQATVFDRDGEQNLTHFQSVNPIQNAIQATWQHSRDTSAVWARRLFGSTDVNYVSPDAIEWLLLEVSGAAAGPTDGSRLLAASYIHRVNTVGGKEPAAPCTVAILNQRQLVPYEADYIFYRPASQGGEE